MADAGGSTRNKRKRANGGTLQHGSRSKRNKGGDMGRNEWSRQNYDRRAQNEASAEKRERIAAQGGRASVLPAPFSQDEIAAEERRPKHKVAVMIGYSGTGYRGMQINNTEKTIEGDLFTAFVAAGAISKANANDPKKSALVRCARTDKGVHAAGNVISLKLIVEDPDIIAKINHNLSPQIRVWGIQRTISSFSCYQACDSRWYEYLIPTHCFVPPHPSSPFGRRLVQLAAETDDLEGYKERQKEVDSFWSVVEETYIKPILAGLDDPVREDVSKALYDTDDRADVQTGAAASGVEIDDTKVETSSPPLSAGQAADSETSDILMEEISSITKQGDDHPQMPVKALVQDQKASHDEDRSEQPVQPRGIEDGIGALVDETRLEESPELIRKKTLDAAIKSLRLAYVAAKRAYRISPERQARVAAALLPFLGTRNFHNYTINKSFRDASAKRNIKSFNLDPTPLLINGTEWLSLKIHGQSFMMHQIRKMISMIALTVRCGCPTSRIAETFGPTSVSIPKVPGLGLLLERPVFRSYNEGAATKFGREEIDFTKFEAEILEFKQREIYERIFREEEQGNAFHGFFNHMDGYTESTFLYLSSKGFSAVHDTGASETSGKVVAAPLDSEDEEADGDDKHEEG